MRTTVYQKFISRYAENFTLVEITEGTEYNHMEILPSAKVAKLSQEEFEDLLQELLDSSNEKASWSDGEDAFDEEDASAADHLKWDEINSAMNNAGM